MLVFICAESSPNSAEIVRLLLTAKADASLQDKVFNLCLCLIIRESNG